MCVYELDDGIYKSAGCERFANIENIDKENRKIDVEEGIAIYL